MTVRRMGIAGAVTAAFIAVAVASAAQLPGRASQSAGPAGAGVHQRSAGSSQPSRVSVYANATLKEGDVSPAHLGDGVCASSFTTNAVVITDAPHGATPRHTEAEAIDASFHDLSAPFRRGRFDAYFAYVGVRPTWVVEVSGLDYPWDAGGVFSHAVVRLHHVVEFIDDHLLTYYETFGCP